MILGQDKLLNIIDSFDLDTLPRSLLLIGEKGSGKHLISKYISEKFNLQLIDITNDLTQESIENIYQRVEPYLYIISAPDITVKDQNTILKFIEEPLKNSFVIILCENKNQLLPTVINRCYNLTLAPYNIETLSRFNENNIDDKLILSIIRTPGELREIKGEHISQMFTLADKMINKISTATLPNALTISNKLNFDNSKDKFDYRIFLRILLAQIKTKIIEKSDKRLYTMYKIVDKVINMIYTPNINVKYIFENMIIKLWLLGK